MRINGILIDPADHVVTLAEAVKVGETVSYVKSGTVYGQTASVGIQRAMGQRERGDMVRRYGDLQEYARMEEADRGRAGLLCYVFIYTAGSGQVGNQTV